MKVRPRWQNCCKEVFLIVVGRTTKYLYCLHVFLYSLFCKDPLLNSDGMGSWLGWRLPVDAYRPISRQSDQSIDHVLSSLTYVRIVSLIGLGIKTHGFG